MLAGTTARTLLGVLEDRAARAIEQYRYLVAQQTQLLEELGRNYERRYQAALKSLQGVRTTEADLVANYRQWCSVIRTTHERLLNGSEGAAQARPHEPPGGETDPA